MHNVGDNDGAQYTKADITLACHLDDSFALSFYQIDYQSVIHQKMAAEQQAGTGEIIVRTKPMVVAKIVLDRESFVRLGREVLAIAKKANIELG